MTTTTTSVADSALDKFLLANFNKADVQLIFATISEDEQEAPDFSKVQITSRVTDRFRGLVAALAERLRGRRSRGDIRLLPYKAGAMNRQEEVEWVELKDAEEVSSQCMGLASVAAMPVFDPSSKSTEDLRFYVVQVTLADKSQINCFRFYSPKSELSRSSLMGIRLSKTVFDSIEEPVFLFDSHIDCIMVGETMFVLSKDKFQKIFRYYERMRVAGRLPWQPLLPK